MENHKWYQDLVDQEISRLTNLHWDDWEAELSGLKYSRDIPEILVSYPSNVYEISSNVDNAEGIWALIRAEKVSKILNDHGNKIIWEIGAGNGGMSIPLLKSGISTIAVEPIKAGAKALAKYGFTSYWGTLKDLNLPTDSIEVIGLFDVLEHIKDPQFLLEEVLRVLKPGGMLILTVPAHQWLFSNFDVTCGHYRRYSKKLLKKTLADARFHRIKSRHFFSYLVLPALLLRRVPYLFGKRSSYAENSKNSKKHNKILSTLSRLVNFLSKIEDNIYLPIGLSIISVSFKEK